MIENGFGFIHLLKYYVYRSKLYFSKFKKNKRRFRGNAY